MPVRKSGTHKYTLRQTMVSNLYLKYNTECDSFTLNKYDVPLLFIRTNLLGKLLKELLSFAVAVKGFYDGKRDFN